MLISFFFSILFLFFLSLIFYIFFIAFVFSLFFFDLFSSSFLISFLLFSFFLGCQDNIISWISSIFSLYLRSFLHLFSFVQFFLSFLLLSIWNWTGHERNIFMGNDSFTEILVIAHQAQRHALNYFHECLTSYAIYSSVVVSSLCRDDCQYKALLFLIMTRTLDAR